MANTNPNENAHKDAGIAVRRKVMGDAYVDNQLKHVVGRVSCCILFVSPMSRAAIPGTLLCFAAMVLLLFVSISVPTWSKVSFLNIGQPGHHQLKYGVFGFTGSSPSVGYFFTNPHMNSAVLHNLTKSLILHPIATGLAGFGFIFGVLGCANFRIGTILMTLLAGLALLTTFVVWVIDMILFGIARQRYRDAGERAQYGNANWLTLGALVALLLAFCASACGVFGRYRRKRDIVY